jgi:small subunit ribosomal protein S20
MRESAVAIAKIAVLSAMRRRGRWGGGVSRGGRAPGGSGGSEPSPPVVWVSIWTRAAIVGPRRGGMPAEAPPSGAADYSKLLLPSRPQMANIKSQKKRIVRAERERLENRRYTSKIKTYFRRLERAVADGDGAQADTEHRELVQTIDKAVKRGALHRNAGARKKSRAARLRQG